MSEYLLKNVASTDYSVSPLVARVFVTTGASTRTITLPDATAPRRNRIITIKKVDSGAGAVKIVGVNSQTLGGNASYSLNKQHQAVAFTTDGSNWSVVGERMDTRVGANGESAQIQQISELITLAAAATSTSATILLPANSLILGVSGRVVTTTITTATLSIGDGTTAGRFGTGILIAAGTTFASLAQFNTANTNAAGPVQVADANIVITPDATPGNALGRVRVTVFYVTITPPAA